MHSLYILSPVVAIIGVVGWAVNGIVRSFVRVPDGAKGQQDVFEPLTIFLSGLAFLSLGLLALALGGIFRRTAIVTVCIVPVLWYGVCIAVRKISFERGSCTRYGLALLVLMIAGVLWAGALPPYEPVLCGNDSSVYLGLSHWLAASGSLVRNDVISTSMNPIEGTGFFMNRFLADAAAWWVRLPGGTIFIGRGCVSTTFYPLLSVWLGAGILFFGDQEYLCLLSLFAVLALAGIFCLGSRLYGRLFGALLSLLIASWAPFIYLTRMPFAESLFMAFLFGGWGGLLAFFDRPHPPKHTQGIIALIGSCAFLTKIDIIFVLPSVLFLIMARSRCRREMFARWRVFLVTGGALIALALCYQLFGHTYLAQALMVITLRGDVITQQYPWVIPAFLYAGIVFFLRVRYRTMTLWTRAGAVILLAAAGGLWALSAGIGPSLYLTGIWCARFLMRTYGNPFVAMAVGVGISLFFLTATWFRPKPGRGCYSVFVLFGVILLVRALPEIGSWFVPLTARKAVVLLVPVMLTLALAGYAQILRCLLPDMRRWVRIAGAGSIAVIFLSGGVPLSLSANAVPLYRHAQAQVRQLAAMIPPEALVLIPDEEAGTHVQTALYWTEQREALMVPDVFDPLIHRSSLLVKIVTNGAGSDAVVPYLDRELGAGRQVFLLSARPEQIPAYLREHYTLIRGPRWEFSFMMMPEQDVHDGLFVPTWCAREYRLIGVVPKKPVRGTVRIFLNGTDDLSVIGKGWYPPEQERRPDGAFRWTDGDATCYLPPTRRVILRIDPRTVPEDGYRLWLYANGVPIYAQTISAFAHEIVADVPVSLAGEDLTLRIVSDTLAASAPKRRPDTRVLGVKVYDLSLDPAHE